MATEVDGFTKTMSLGNEMIPCAKRIVDRKMVHEIGKCRQKWKEHVQMMGTDCPEQRININVDNNEGSKDLGELGRTNTLCFAMSEKSKT